MNMTERITTMTETQGADHSPNEVKIIEQAMFRELYHRFQFIECPEEIDDLRGELPVMDGATGILTYCFIEEGQGLSFYILSTARIRRAGTNDGSETKLSESSGLMLESGPDTTEHMARVRYRDVCYYRFYDQENFDLDWSRYDEICAEVKENFETKDRLRQMVYDLELLDENRNVEVPEYVSVVVQKEGLYPEYIWVRCVAFGEKEVYGEILEPPKQDYGLEKDQRIAFQMVEYDGKIYTIWNPNIRVRS